MSVAARFAEVEARVAAAAQASGRSAHAVTLVTVTKEVGLDAIREAIAAGARNLGENRAQELAPKAEALVDVVPAPQWHFIGQLQRNKVRTVAAHVTLWQSVDRESLAREIAQRAPDAPVLVQVNVGEEPQKGGCAVADTPALVDAARSAGCRVDGLMTVPPATGDPRRWFAQLRRLVDDLGLSACSMGMSGDFEAAIAEGATIVRVGSSIFGPRPSAVDARR